MLVIHRAGKPLVQSGPPSVGQGVNPASGLATLPQVRLAFDQTGFIQAVKRGVDLGRFNIPGFRATDHRLEGSAQFVAMAWLLGK